MRSAQGGILCQLPCAGWVGTEAGLVLVEDDFLVDGQPVTFPVPSQLPAGAESILSRHRRRRSRSRRTMKSAAREGGGGAAEPRRRQRVERGCGGPAFPTMVHEVT